MALYVIGDLHLAFGVEKPMDIFGGWEGYMEKIEENWLITVKPEDTVVLAGDTSWGMSLEQSLPDFKFIDNLPGKKLILKGNHDYWWGSVTSMKNFFEKHSITTIDFLHNNSFIVEGKAVCGSRGWMFEDGAEHNEKIIKREAIRIEASLKSVKEDAEKVLFLHYPPLYGSQELTEYINIMQEHGVKRCYYGHIHGRGHTSAVVGERYGIEFFMISSDYLGFMPKIVK